MKRTPCLLFLLAGSGVLEEPANWQGSKVSISRFVGSTPLSGPTLRVECPIVARFSGLCGHCFGGKCNEVWQRHSYWCCRYCSNSHLTACWSISDERRPLTSFLWDQGRKAVARQRARLSGITCRTTYVVLIWRWLNLCGLWRRLGSYFVCNLCMMPSQLWIVNHETPSWQWVTWGRSIKRYWHSSIQ